MPALAGKVAIVTGASSGIGAAAAMRLAGEGATVVITGRRSERLDALRARIADREHVVVVPGDLTRAADREELVGAALRVSGRIDVLVNNAGWGQRGPVEEVPVDAMRANFETNVFSTIALTQAVIPHMRAQRSGRIIMISSIAGRIARPFSSVYDATKHAIEALSDGLREELAPFGIAVAVIEPGFIATEFGDVADSRDVPGGAYASHIAEFRAGEDKRRRMAGTTEEIAELIAAAATADRPRTRYAAPRFARVALLVKRLLPDDLFYRIAIGRSPKNRT